MDKARAVVQTAVGRYETREVPIPDPGADGAVMRVEACGLGGSEVRLREQGGNGRADGHPPERGIAAERTP